LPRGRARMPRAARDGNCSRSRRPRRRVHDPAAPAYDARELRGMRPGGSGMRKARLFVAATLLAATVTTACTENTTKGAAVGAAAGAGLGALTGNGILSGAATGAVAGGAGGF